MQAAPLPHHTNQRAGRFMHNFVIIRPIPLGCTQPFPTTEMPTERHESNGAAGSDRARWAVGRHRLGRAEASRFASRRILAFQQFQPMYQAECKSDMPPVEVAAKNFQGDRQERDPDSMRCLGARARSFLLLIACGSGRGPLRLWLQGTRGHRGKVEKSSQPHDVRRLDRKNPPSCVTGSRVGERAKAHADPLGNKHTRQEPVPTQDRDHRRKRVDEPLGPEPPDRRQALGRPPGRRNRCERSPRRRRPRLRRPQVLQSVAMAPIGGNCLGCCGENARPRSLRRWPNADRLARRPVSGWADIRAPRALPAAYTVGTAPARSGSLVALKSFSNCEPGQRLVLPPFRT
jgi:hypothetical protein